MTEVKKTKLLERLGDVPHGTVFDYNEGIYIKLMNPEIPSSAQVGSFPVWAVDVGNGHIIRLSRKEVVLPLGHAYYLICKAIPQLKRGAGRE